MQDVGKIHRYKLGGHNIIIDVNSNAVHVADELTYDLLSTVMPPFPIKLDERTMSKLMRFYTEEEINECYAEIRELFAQDLLYSSDEYAEYASACVPSPTKAMCLLVAEDCNLRCKYCFASGGDYGKGVRTKMELKTAKAALDFLIKQSADRENLEVDFFGGEPLLNWDVVTETVKYGRELGKLHNKNIRFTITTNGLLLDDEKTDFINKEMSNVVLSLDGRREVHDNMRVTENGKPTYDLVIDKIKDLIKKRDYKNYYIRGTFTKQNPDFSKDVFALWEEGFDQISVEPVIADSESDFAITEKELPAVFAEYEKLAKMLINQRREDGKHINFFHFMLDLDAGPCAIKRLRGCGCGNEYVAITPDGDIFPCHQFSDKSGAMKMGNIFDGTFNLDMKAEFAASHIYNKPDCFECWAKFYCSGGCAANNWNFGKDIKKPVKIYCELQKKRLECAIFLKTEDRVQITD
ncbi:MAG: thioether cross-link-forming SCIFF peptide maturase [Ruminococcus sp.]|jgi:uncharacterized protein|nr:thioether cross-link-forming SCIFF peptide maturase [Ruminococcus sp.]